MLKKRAYLAQFLVDIEIPPDLSMDEDVISLQAQCLSLQETFKANHSRRENVQQMNMKYEPLLLTEKVQELEAERDHLVSKLSKLRCKIQNIDKWEHMLELVEVLRAESSEEESIQASIEEHRDILSMNATRHEKAWLRLEQVRALTLCPTAVILQKMSEDSSMLRYLAKSKLPKEVENKRIHLQALEYALSDTGHGEEKVGNVQAKLLAANNELKQLRKKSISGKKMHSLSAITREGVPHSEQAELSTATAERLKDSYEALTLLKKQTDHLMIECHNKVKIAKEVKGTLRHGQELKQYVESLRMKSTMYKSMKKEIDDLHAEKKVLRRTQVILEEQLSAMPHLPSQENILADPVQRLHQDDEKAIGSLCTLIREVAETINEHKQKLAPKVKVLQKLKTTLEQTEIVHLEKKHHYSEVYSFFKRKMAGLGAEVESTRHECDQENNRYKEVSLERRSLGLSLEELMKEKENGKVSTSLYANVDEEESQSKSLVQRQQNLKEVEQHNQLQMCLIKGLATLINARLRQYSFIQSSEMPASKN